MNNTSVLMGTDVNSNAASNGSAVMNSAASSPALSISGNAISGDSYNVYYGTGVASLLSSARLNFGKDFPASTNEHHTWNQYGDWFSTHDVDNGRLTQYFYDGRGNGYSLSLPVVQTYVPEEVIDKALRKYGTHLYSIGMVITAEGNSAYQIGLLNRGQLHNEYLNEEGVLVANVWRTEEINISSTSTNAAMGDTHGNEIVSAANGDNVSIRAYQDTTGKPKIKMKIKNGKMKTKHKGHKNGMDSTFTFPAMKEQLI